MTILFCAKFNEPIFQNLSDFLFLHPYEPEHNLSLICNLPRQSGSHRLYWLSTSSNPDNIKRSHTHKKKEINFWDDFCFEYNMRKSVRPKCAVSLRHVMKCSRIHTKTAAWVFFRLFPQYYSNTLLFSLSPSVYAGKPTCSFLWRRVSL